MINTIIALIFAFLVVVVLLWASWHDIKSRTIPKLSVALVYGFVMGYLVFANKDLTEASFCFMFTFVSFLCLWAISFGNFGIGDVLILGALGWMVGDLVILKAFLIVLGALTIPYGIFCYWYFRKEAAFYKKHSNGKTPFLYPYMPIVCFTLMLYLVIPSIFETIL